VLASLLLLEDIRVTVGARGTSAEHDRLRRGICEGAEPVVASNAEVPRHEDEAHDEERKHAGGEQGRHSDQVTCRTQALPHRRKLDEARWAP
jgi:hypothetical protein